MREGKFDFGNKKIDTTHVGNVLKNEDAYAEYNYPFLKNYFFMREFLQMMIEDENNIAVAGSNSFIMHSKLFRIPCDIDLIYSNPKHIYELVKDIAERDNHDGIQYKLSQHLLTANNVLQAQIVAKMPGLKSTFNIDIVPGEVETETLTMKKIISTDQLFDAKTLKYEDIIAGKIESVIRGPGWKEDRILQTRIKDLYDVYMLCKERPADIRAVNDFLAARIEKRIFQGSLTKDKVSEIQGNIEGLLSGHEEAWSAVNEKWEIKPDISSEEVAKFGTELIQEMELK